MDAQSFVVFAVAALLLNITPGNDMLYVLTRSVSQGRGAGIVSALGIMAGCMIHVLAAVFGLSLIVSQSAIVFAIIKYLGAAYLIYLGFRAVFTRKSAPEGLSGIDRQSMWKLFWQGLVTNVLNPKVALFFLAFLPQFVTQSGDVPLQILLLGLWFNTSGTLVNIVVAVVAGTLAARLSGSKHFAAIQTWLKRCTGAVMIALGIKVALSSRTQRGPADLAAGQSPNDYPRDGSVARRRDAFFTPSDRRSSTFHTRCRELVADQ